jgi:hypothetical protein
MMSIVYKAIILTGLVLLSACVSQEINKLPEGIKVALEKDVTNCEFKGDVDGVSSLYGVFAEVAISKARQQAFNQAIGYGANTVVFQPFSTEYGATSVHGNAYFCK